MTAKIKQCNIWSENIRIPTIITRNTWSSRLSKNDKGITRRFDWIVKTIKTCIKGCDKCQRCKDHMQPQQIGESKPFIPKQKGQMLSCDFYGPLPILTGGVQHILVFVDNFTKYVKLYKLKRTTKVAIKKFIKYIYKTWENQNIYSLITNRIQFTARKKKRELQELQIKPIYTTVRNPCSN